MRLAVAVCVLAGLGGCAGPAGLPSSLAAPDEVNFSAGAEPAPQDMQTAQGLAAALLAGSAAPVRPEPSDSDVMALLRLHTSPAAPAPMAYSAAPLPQMSPDEVMARLQKLSEAYRHSRRTASRRACTPPEC